MMLKDSREPDFEPSLVLISEVEEERNTEIVHLVWIGIGRMKMKLVFYVGSVALLGSKFGEARGCFEIGEVIIINYLGGRNQ